MSELVFLIIILILMIGIFVWYGFILIGELMAGPYIPTHQDEIEMMLEKINLQKGKVFMELGSGDGRVVRTAVKMYGVKGVGVEMHPLVCWWSRILNKIQKVKDITNICGSFYGRELPVADYYYIYLTPRGTNEVGEKIFKKLSKGKIIVSKAFEINCLKNRLNRVFEVNGNKYFEYSI